MVVTSGLAVVAGGGKREELKSMALVMQDE